MLNGPAFAVAWLSALSFAVPGTGLPLWVSSIVAGFEHDCTPESASLQANVTVTGALYQPLALAARSGEPVMVGLGRSIFIPLMLPLPELPATSVAVPDTVWLAP